MRVYIDVEIDDGRLDFIVGLCELETCADTCWEIASRRRPMALGALFMSWERVGTFGVGLNNCSVFRLVNTLFLFFVVYRLRLCEKKNLKLFHTENSFFTIISCEPRSIAEIKDKFTIFCSTSTAQVEIHNFISFPKIQKKK